MARILSADDDSVIHLVHGDSAGGSLRSGPSGHVVCLPDVLADGPSHTECETHAVLRRDHWSSMTWLGEHDDLRRHLRSVRTDILAARQLIEALARFPRSWPVVIWTTRAWSDQLQLWWVLHALETNGSPLGRIYLAELRGTIEEFGMGCFRPQEFRSAVPGARPVTRATLREGASLWLKFASDSPLGFDAAARRGSPRFPGLPLAAESFSRHFPRSLRNGSRLALSEFDRALLGLLSIRRWETAVCVVGEILTAIPTWGMGEWSVFERLLDWAGHHPWSPALAVRCRPGRSGWNRFQMRLTERGESILRKGIAEPWEAPPFWAGGTSVYSAGVTWVKRTRGRSWRIEEL